MLLLLHWLPAVKKKKLQLLHLLSSWFLRLLKHLQRLPQKLLLPQQLKPLRLLLIPHLLLWTLLKMLLRLLAPLLKLQRSNSFCLAKKPPYGGFFHERLNRTGLLQIVGNHLHDALGIGR